MERENQLLVNKNVLVCTTELQSSELDYIKQNFCGLVCKDLKVIDEHPLSLICICGNIGNNLDNTKHKNIFVVKEFSTDYTLDSQKYKVISSGQVPINVNNVGVLFRNFFYSGKDYFNLITNEHKFQALTESNKPGTAFRSGIYLTKVQEDANNDEIKFKLLRCSSNLSGPTDNFRTTDTEVVDQVNEITKYFFKEKTELNHVLAQVYENKTLVNDNNKTKEKKAKIKKHSDKTKDMPRNGLMAFCTFYKTDELNNISKSKTDPFDYCYHDTSVLTTLRFELKKMVTDEKLKKKFDVVLYPNSVFIMSLDMNRLYTHAIAPSSLPVDKLATRLGYVIRCSKTDAVFKDGQTYIVDDSKYVKLEEQTDEGVKELKDLYFKENATDEMIHYGKFHFSLNSGDYLKPLV